MTLISKKSHIISKRLLCLFLLFTCFLSIILLSRHIHTSLHRSIMPLNFTSRHPYIALIVDDRATELLVDAVTNVLQHIPIDWSVQIVTPYEHWLFYMNSSLGSFIKANRVFLTPLRQPRRNLSGGDFINLVLTSASFWRQVQGDKVLLFQTDSVLCSNSLYNLTDFLQYDFIGAPLFHGGCCNGGLSIRSRTKMLQLLEGNHVRFRLHEVNEDGWFATYLSKVNGSVASVSIAKRFAVESIFYRHPFAVHRPHTKVIGADNMILLCNDCPEVRTITYCQSVMNTSDVNN